MIKSVFLGAQFQNKNSGLDDKPLYHLLMNSENFKLKIEECR